MMKKKGTVDIVKKEEEDEKKNTKLPVSPKLNKASRKSTVISDEDNQSPSNALRSRLPAALGGIRRRSDDEEKDKNSSTDSSPRALERKSMARKIEPSWVTSGSPMNSDGAMLCNTGSLPRSNFQARTGSPVLGTGRSDSPDTHRLSRKYPPTTYSLEELCNILLEGNDIPRFNELLSVFPKEQINDYNSKGQTLLYCAAKYVHPSKTSL